IFFLPLLRKRERVGVRAGTVELVSMLLTLGLRPRLHALAPLGPRHYSGKYAICIATSMDEELLVIANQRLGLSKLFRFWYFPSTSHPLRSSSVRRSGPPSESI